MCDFGFYFRGFVFLCLCYAAAEIAWMSLISFALIAKEESLAIDRSGGVGS